MTENTAKIVDFQAFRSTRKVQLITTHSAETAPEAIVAPVAAAPVLWPVYWVYYPGFYVSSGF